MRKCKQYIHDTIMHSSISSTSLARIMPREFHADEMATTGYNVINTVSSLKKLNVAKFVSVRAAFALHFKRLGRRN